MDEWRGRKGIQGMGEGKGMDKQEREEWYVLKEVIPTQLKGEVEWRDKHTDRRTDMGC